MCLELLLACEVLTGRGWMGQLANMSRKVTGLPGLQLVEQYFGLGEQTAELLCECLHGTDGLFFATV